MTHYDTIRAALEAAIAYPNSTHAELKAHEALAALAELGNSAAPKFEAADVDDECARRLWREWFDAGCMTGLDTARFWLRVWRRELGPTLGMVALREPTPDECEKIAHTMIGLFNKLGKDQPSTPEDTVARVIFPAVRAVMGGGS